MESVAFYEAVTDTLGLSVEGGHVMSVEEDGNKPVICRSGGVDKEVVLPTPEIMKNTDWAKYVALAPLGENMLRGESEIIRTLLTITKVQLNIRFGELLPMLTQLAMKKELHKDLSPEQLELMDAMPVVDERFAKDLNKSLEKMDLKTHETCLIDINLRRNAMFNDAKAARLANISFPVMEAGTHDKIMGVSWRVKDIAMLQELHKFVFPDSDVAGLYSHGTDSKVAPYLVALLGAYEKVQNRLNHIAKLFGKEFPQFKAVGAPMKFTKYMNKLTQLRDELPVLQGNEGIVPKGGDHVPEHRADPVAPATPRHRPAVSVAATVAAAPRPKADDPSLPWNDQAPAAQAPRHPERPAAAAPQAAADDAISYEDFQRQRQQAMTPPPGYQYNQPTRQMTIHDVAQGTYQDYRRPQNRVEPGYEVGNSPYSEDYRAPISAQPQQQQYAPGTRYLHQQQQPAPARGYYQEPAPQPNNYGGRRNF